MSVTSREIGHFYDNVETLTDDQLSMIFSSPSGDRPTRPTDYSQEMVRYKNIKKFRNQYHGLYNAMKHGNRVIHMEISKKDTQANSLVGTYVTYQWAEPRRHSSKNYALRTREGSEIHSEIADFAMKTELVSADSIDEFVLVAMDCHQIITDILQAHAPPHGAKV